MADTWDRLFRAFRDKDRNWRLTVYVYRLSHSGRVLKPYIYKSCGEFESDTQLLYFLQDEFDEGDFKILIREGSSMIYSGEVSVGRRPVRNT